MIGKLDQFPGLIKDLYHPTHDIQVVRDSIHKEENVFEACFSELKNVLI